MEQTVLSTENLSIGYKGKVLIEGLNLKLEKGLVTALVGKNGIGKSTLLKTLTRELPTVKGEIFLSGKNIKYYSQRDLAKELSIVTTSSVTAGGLKVKEVVEMGRHPYTGMLGLLRSDDKLIVESAIKQVGIEYKTESYISELSDGERQKVMIARAIAQDTPVIILDEPFSFLDVASRIEILSLLKEIAKESDKTVLFSTHDVSQALRMSDRLWMLTPGRKLHDSTPQIAVTEGIINELFETPTVVFDKSQMDFVKRSD